MNAPILPEPLKALLPPDLHAQAQGLHLARHARLFRTGDRPRSMFYVVSGEVTLERSGLHGQPVVLQRTRQGFVSEASLQVERYHCDAVAVSESLVIQLPAPALARALESDPAFAGRWIAMLNREVRRLRLHCERLSMKSVRERLVHLIETEGQAGHYPTPSGLKTLAGELGITHEALYRTVADLEQQGRLMRKEGALVLRPI